MQTIRDTSKEKQIEQAKDDFISIVSHQLRTPLTAIRLFTEMLSAGQVGKLNAEQKDYLDKIEDATMRMISLVGSILNVSRLELGRLKIEPVKTKIDELISSRLDEVQALAKVKNIKIKFTKSDNVPAVPLDTALLGEVIHNLLTNAIRYSPEDKGVVEITAGVVKDGITIEVKDNGIGIPLDVQDKMFTRFFRAENAIAVVGEGTGLGLYLIKLIMEAAGGKVWFESVENKGTKFYVKIPLEGMKAKQGDRSIAISGKI